MVDETGNEAPKPKPANIYASVRLILGDDVVVEAAGLKAQLQGNLMVSQTPRFPPRATGNMGIVSGEYILYGQKLDIKRGEVLFSNSPLDNPGLDLEVQRQIDNVIAGARVRGTLQDPELILFSDPPMGDNDIISYLIFGSPSSENLRGARMTIGRYLTPDLYISYGIGLFDKVNTFNMRYRLTDRLHVESTASSGRTGADLIYIIDR
jgi:translocation and assembly module TamB